MLIKFSFYVVDNHRALYPRDVLRYLFWNIAMSCGCTNVRFFGFYRYLTNISFRNKLETSKNKIYLVSAFS